MALSLQTQWTLLASGLVAHADHVLAGEECERLMAMVDQEVDGDDYAQWMGIISEPDKLASMLESLENPPADTHRAILEEAWLMAVVDGERADEELEVLRQVATRLGVQSSQLDTWRDEWTASQANVAEVAVAALAWVLGGGDEVVSEDQGAIDDFVHALPTTHEHRETLLATARQGRDKAAAHAQVTALTERQQKDLLQRLGEATPGATDPDTAQARCAELATALGIEA